MKLKRVLVVTVFVLIVLSLAMLPAIANAYVDCSVGRIARLGLFPGTNKGIMVQLFDESPSPSWTGKRQFYLSETLGNQGLATLLTAYSLGKTVWVRIEGDASSNSLISIIYIND